MKWYCALKQDIEVDGIVEGRLYPYKTTRDYDMMFTVFNGKTWIECNSEYFNKYYLI